MQPKFIIQNGTSFDISKLLKNKNVQKVPVKLVEIANYLTTIKEEQKTNKQFNIGNLLLYFSFLIAVFDCFIWRNETVRYQKIKYRITDLPLSSEDVIKKNVSVHIQNWLFLLILLDFYIFSKMESTLLWDELKQSLKYWVALIQLFQNTLCESFTKNTAFFNLTWFYQEPAAAQQQNWLEPTIAQQQDCDLINLNKNTSLELEQALHNNVFVCKFYLKKDSNNNTLFKKKEEAVFQELLNFKTKLGSDLAEIHFFKMDALNLQVNPYNFESKALTVPVNNFPLEADPILFILNYYKKYFSDNTLPNIPYTTYMVFFSFTKNQDLLEQAIRCKKAQRYAKSFFRSCNKHLISNAYQTAWVSAHVRNNYLTLFDADIRDCLHIKPIFLEKQK